MILQNLYLTYHWENGSIPDDLKIARVTAVKGGDLSKLGNYRPLPCSHVFPKYLRVLFIIFFTNIS